MTGQTARREMLRGLFLSEVRKNLEFVKKFYEKNAYVIMKKTCKAV